MVRVKTGPRKGCGVPRQPALYYPASDGDVAEVARLIAKGSIDAVSCDRRMSRRSTRRLLGTHLEVVRLLLNKGAQVELEEDCFQNTWRPPRIAPRLPRDRPPSHRRVPSAVHRENEDKYTPLHRASFNGHHEVVRLLIDKGASVDAIDNGGWTPLHCAAYSSHLETARLLVHAGARDVRAKNQFGCTPSELAQSLHVRANPGRGAIVTMLDSLRRSRRVDYAALASRGTKRARAALLLADGE